MTTKKEVADVSIQYPLDPIMEVMDKLLSPDGCPWDREQTPQSLKRYLLEETYEVIEAIDEGDVHKLCEELGDLLLQIVFHAALAAKENKFTMNDIIQGITDKMIRRHPHVFGDVAVSGSREVLKNWEAIKLEEKGRKKPTSLLGTIPKDLPSLMHALKVQEKAAKVGFDWPNIEGAWDKVYEELGELDYAIKEKGEIYEELGDVLFAVVNVARFLNINPEEALLATIRKFRTRFSFIENKVGENGKNIANYSLDELDKWWEEAKAEEK